MSNVCSVGQCSNFLGLGLLPHRCTHPPYCRKENQVYTAEEKAALAMFNFEENKRKEQKILEDLRRLVDRTLGQGEEDEGMAGPPAPPA